MTAGGNISSLALDGGLATAELDGDRGHLANEPQSKQNNFILVGLDRLSIAFPADAVAEILIMDRSQVLPLSFYDPAICGVIHHGGQIVPLVSMRQLFGVPASMGEKFTVVRLGEVIEDLVGVGLIVDKTLGIAERDSLPPELFDPNSNPDRPPENVQLFRPEMLSDRLWQPQRWEMFASK